MERPVGVTILAVLGFLGAAFTLMAGLAIFAGGAMISRMAGTPVGMLAGIGGAIIAATFLVFAVLYVIVSVGLLKLQNWARVILIVLIFLGLLSSAFGLLTALMHIHMFLFFWRAIIAAIQVWILLYLFKPHVKQAFGTTGF
jgi:uncharacterized membrane protein (DUF2068 family)